jgi:hypothetical protein
MKNKRKYRKKNIEQEKKIWNQKIKRNIDRKIRKKKKNRNKISYWAGPSAVIFYQAS